nr:hypothetical protein [Leuconostoc mesenteroides]
MYTAGKVWLFAGLSVLVIDSLGQVAASTDTTSTDTASTAASTSDNYRRW